MYKFVVFLALVVLAVATPAPKENLKTDSTIGLGYAGFYGGYPYGVNPLVGAYNPYIRTGARSLWNTYPYGLNPTVYNPAIYNPTVIDPIVDPFVNPIIY